MSEDERPEDEEGRDELAAFEALGGQLTWDELARLLGHGDGQALSRALLALLAYETGLVTPGSRDPR